MGIGSRPKSIDVHQQDQYSDVIDIFATNKLGTATLLSPTVKDTRSIALATGHGFVAGNMIEINNTEDMYQSRVLSATTNAVVVTNPMTKVFAVDATVRRTSPNANIDGSVTPVTFTVCPPPGVFWDINILSINILGSSSTAMDDSLFGNITALTNGVLYRTVDGKTNHFLTALDNGCFIRHCDTENPYSSKAPSGAPGFNTKRYFNSQQGDGVALRLGGTACKEFRVIVQDNITGLGRYWNVLRGHKVVDPVPGDKTRMTITSSWTPITSAGQAGVMWLMHDADMLITSSTNGTPSDTTAYPLYRGKILPLEPDDNTDRFYARTLQGTADIVVDILG